MKHGQKGFDARECGRSARPDELAEEPFLSLVDAFDFPRIRRPFEKLRNDLFVFHAETFREKTLGKLASLLAAELFPCDDMKRSRIHDDAVAIENAP
jgi:hypothetical protein